MRSCVAACFISTIRIREQAQPRTLDQRKQSEGCCSDAIKSRTLLIPAQEIPAVVSSSSEKIPTPVILSAAPRSSVLHEVDGRGVEGPQERRQRERRIKAFSPSIVQKTPWNGMVGDTPSGFEFPRLRSGFRLRAQTPAKRLNFDAHSSRRTPVLALAQNDSLRNSSCQKGTISAAISSPQGSRGWFQR